MSEHAAHQLTATLAQRVVASAAPHEMAIFRAASRAYFANPNRALRRRPADEMLGFGVESTSVLTPYVLAVVDAVVDRLKDDLGPDLRALGPDQLAHARDLARVKARELGLEEDKARQLAENLVSVLRELPS